MKSYLVGENDAGQRLDRFLHKVEPACSPALIQKAIRKKQVRVDGARADGALRLLQGQTVTFRVPPALFAAQNAAAPGIHTTSSGHGTASPDFLRIDKPNLAIVYEDEDLLVLHKPAGLMVHADEHGGAHSLLSHATRYLYDKGAYNPALENSFAPALAHRLDRNTEGLCLLAKNAETLRILNEKFKAREIDKRYLCVVLGTPPTPEGLLRDTLLRDKQQKQVYRVAPGTPDAKTALTAYRVLFSRNGLSALECHLLTGRTHQIRAQCAGAGFPLLGDGKYGIGHANRRYGVTHQALMAYRLTLDFRTPAGRLERLRGRVFELPAAPFWARYFG